MKLSLEDGPAVGLRERKKAKTRAAIQEQALRLFSEQGYEATTVEQIAEAAEVSPSTFFRYFPTKEDVVLYDVVDPLIYEAFRAQPAELRPLPALRAAFRAAFAALPPAEVAAQRRRAALVLMVPELRMRMLDEITHSMQALAEVIGERVGRPADDLAVRTFVGAVMGALIAVWLATPEESRADYFVMADYMALADATLGELEAGLLF
jgi:AcrR family transcriptional regulator